MQPWKSKATTGNYNEHLNKSNKRNFYKWQGTPSNLASMILYALHSRYTSLQEKSPMLSLLLLNNIQQCGVDALKALKTLYEKASFLMTVFWW